MALREMAGMGWARAFGGSPQDHPHGGQPQEAFERLGVSARPVLDFSTNQSPLGPPERVRQIWPELLDVATRYPSQEGEGLVRYHQLRFGLPPGAVLAGNGSIAWIHDLPRLLKPRRLRLFHPCFADYLWAGWTAGARLSEVFLDPGQGFAYPENLSEGLEAGDMVLVGTPSNPAGQVLAAGRVLEEVDRYPDIWWVLDLAFAGFQDPVEGEALLRPSSLRVNLLLLSSLTKLYALPGLRLGALVGHPDTLARIRPHVPPWRVNALADRLAPLLAEEEAFRQQTRQEVEKERQRMRDGLAGVNGLEAIPSHGPFLLMRWRSREAGRFWPFLLERGLWVREPRGYLGLEEGFFRVGLRRPEENARLLQALEDFSRG